MNENKNLSTRSLNKLKILTKDEKVRLFARTCLISLNQKMRPIIYNTVGCYSYEETKAEILHHLFDQNDPYQFPQNFSDVQKILNAHQSVYKKFDTYTLCAYVLYYKLFVNTANNSKTHVKTMRDIRAAKEKASEKIWSFADIKNMSINYVERPEAKIDSLLKKEYRNAILVYLIDDLKIKNAYSFLLNYIKEKNNEKTEHFNNSNNDKIYANQVEEYKDNEGNAFYLDSEGNIYKPEEISDYTFEKYKMKATKNGFITEDNKDNFTF